MVMFSGCRGDASSPAGRRPWRHARALTCASTSFHTPLERAAEPIGELLAQASVRYQPDRPGSVSLPCAARNSAAPSHTQVASYDRSASLEVCAPAAFTGTAMRYPERPGSGRSRFGVRRCPPAHLRTTRTALSPVRFSAWRMRCGEARCADEIACRFAPHRAPPKRGG
jgi:hypothetical protein